MVAARRSMVAWVLAVVALALLVGACGGGVDKGAYERGMRGVGAQISKASSATAGLSADATNAQRVTAIRMQAAAIGNAADQAAALAPPADASKAHKQLVSALKDYAVLLGDLADASNDTAQQSKLLGRAGAIVDRLKTSSTSLEKAGYSFGIDRAKATTKTTGSDS
ncbi:MAG: hypothetical protein H7287_08515 [Thermoleophilia bacterium]|nr:hypothetical protein [Thermoleophilia bacterium]